MAVADMNKPRDTLQDVALRGFLLDKRTGMNLPGEFILSLNKDTRDILKKLKSDDIKNIRIR